MSTWPATLPQRPLVDGWSEAFADTGIRTSMDVGPAKTRRRTSAGEKKYEVSFYMTSAQVDILETFYSTNLASGTIEFTWNHPRTGNSESWRFTGPPETISKGIGYIASFGLEQMP